MGAALPGLCGDEPRKHAQPSSRNEKIVEPSLKFHAAHFDYAQTPALGGTGLLVMGYLARKRLFGMGRRLAV